MRDMMQKNSVFVQGQILLITLLVLTVATTIALSLIGRTTIDLSMSNQLEESARAFNAAEAGVEQALKSGLGTNGPSVLTSGVTYDVTVNSIGGASGVYQLPHQTPQNVTETIWLVEHDPDTGLLNETPYYTAGSIVLCWSPEIAPDPAAGLVVTALYKEGTDATYKVARMAVDPNAVTNNNNFDDTGISTAGCGLGYYRKLIDFTALGITPTGVPADTLLALRIRPVYADTTIALDSGSPGLPKQGNQIESVGSTGTGVSRKVVVFQQYRAPLSLFDSVIYSQSAFGH